MPPFVRVPGGPTVLGSRDFYAEELPIVQVDVGEVLWQPHPVTNAAFARFVEATGYPTVAERPLDAAQFPGVPADQLAPGSQVFTPTSGPVDLTDWQRWWRWQPGASWRAPQGPGSHWQDLADHPVVHVGWEDAAAYAVWLRAELPTEAEFEHAARGGLPDATYAWGEELAPGGTTMANTWQGAFPWRSDDPLGHDRTSPVGSYPANGFGLFDMIGNVWEWTRTRWTPTHLRLGDDLVHQTETHGCCGPARPDVVDGDRMVTKGGSHLCSPGYCRRYRPAARQGHGVRDTTSHVGFRCVRHP
jgi:formylglycine-generating enzyme